MTWEKITLVEFQKMLLFLLQEIKFVNTTPLIYCLIFFFFYTDESSHHMAVSAIDEWQLKITGVLHLWSLSTKK